MKIHGLQKMTLLDFPGRVACTVFFGGCDMRCPFCHNAELIDGTAPAVMEEEELLSFLEKRKGLLDGVAVTGGEPTLQKDLPEFFRKVKANWIPTGCIQKGWRSSSRKSWWTMSQWISRTLRKNMRRPQGFRL